MSVIVSHPFNDTSGSMFNKTVKDLPLTLATSLPFLFICLLGLSGNAVVFWCLCFRIERNPFTVYILNMAAADFFFLLCNTIALLYGLIIIDVEPVPHSNEVIMLAMRILFCFGSLTSLYLLTGMSVERCLSVLHPIWYKCHRPTHSSTVSCALLWVLAILVTFLAHYSCTFDMYYETTPQCTAVVLFMLCLSFGIVMPLMILSSALLIFKVHRSSMRPQPLRLYRVIILNVLVFLATSFPGWLPWNLLYFRIINNSEFNQLAIYYAYSFCSIINSSANPFIYFLIGRGKTKRSVGFFKQSLLKVFRVDYEMPRDDLNIG